MTTPPVSNKTAVGKSPPPWNQIRALFNSIASLYSPAARTAATARGIHYSHTFLKPLSVDFKKASSALPRLAIHPADAIRSLPSPDTPLPLAESPVAPVIASLDSFPDSQDYIVPAAHHHEPLLAQESACQKPATAADHHPIDASLSDLQDLAKEPSHRPLATAPESSLSTSTLAAAPLLESSHPDTQELPVVNDELNKRPLVLEDQDDLPTDTVPEPSRLIDDVLAQDPPLPAAEPSLIDDSPSTDSVALEETPTKQVLVESTFEDPSAEAVLDDSANPAPITTHGLTTSATEQLPEPIVAEPFFEQVSEQPVELQLVEHKTPEQLYQHNESDQLPEEVSEQLPEEVPEQLPEEVPEQLPEEVPEQLPEEVTEQLPEEVPEDKEVSEQLPEQLPEEVPEVKEVSEQLLEQLPEEITEQLPEVKDVSDQLPEQLSEQITEEVFETKVTKSPPIRPSPTTSSSRLPIRSNSTPMTPDKRRTSKIPAARPTMSFSLKTAGVELKTKESKKPPPSIAHRISSPSSLRPQSPSSPRPISPRPPRPLTKSSSISSPSTSNGSHTLSPARARPVSRMREADVPMAKKTGKKEDEEGNDEEEEQPARRLTVQEKRRREAMRAQQIKVWRVREEREERNARVVARRKMLEEGANEVRRRRQLANGSVPVTTPPTTPPRRTVKFNLNRNKTIEIAQEAVE